MSIGAISDRLQHKIRFINYTNTSVSDINIGNKIILETMLFRSRLSIQLASVIKEVQTKFVGSSGRSLRNSLARSY